MAAAAKPTVTRSFHTVAVDGREVQLRVFVPGATNNGVASKQPAVVMVCGLLWLGGGVLGRIGLAFNDGFGHAFAKCGTPCVQVHTPCRHMGHTRIQDITALLLWPLSVFIPLLTLPLLIGDVLMLAISPLDFALLLLAPLLSFLGPLAQPAMHLLVRGAQWMQGSLPAPAHRPHQEEIAAAIAWAQGHQEVLGSDGRLVLCGYSSGGHCAALYALAAAAPRFEAVVLISGIYSLRTHTWTGGRRIPAPVFDLLFRDTLGVGSPGERDAASPELLLAGRRLDGQDWYVLSARMELMGLQPFEDILFQAEPLCAALKAKGASVHRVTCGLNHWLLVLGISDFIRPFCKGLSR